MKMTVRFMFLIVMMLGMGCAKKVPLDTAKEETMQPVVVKVIPTTYATDIQPLLIAKCAPCHFPLQGGNKASFESYESVKNYAAEIIRRVELAPTVRGFMPFRKTESLPAAEIALLKKWVSDGTLEK